MDRPPASIVKIKEENLNEGIVELDMTALSSINPTGDNSEHPDFVAVPLELQMELQREQQHSMEI